jgi:hypothetical protein
MGPTIFFSFFLLFSSTPLSVSPRGQAPRCCPEGAPAQDAEADCARVGGAQSVAVVLTVPRMRSRPSLCRHRRSSWPSMGSKVTSAPVVNSVAHCRRPASCLASSLFGWLVADG